MQARVALCAYAIPSIGQNSSQLQTVTARRRLTYRATEAQSFFVPSCLRGPGVYGSESRRVPTEHAEARRQEFPNGFEQQVENQFPQHRNVGLRPKRR